MIFRLEVENFCSIGRRQIIDLRARAGVNGCSLAPIYCGSTERAPKVVAVFGPNASGKTNFLRAIAFLVWFAKDSFTLSPGERLPLALFQRQEWLQKPTWLAIEIGWKSLFSSSAHDSVGHGVYRYELEIARRPHSDTVVRENLFFRPHRARKPFRVFERTEKGGVKGSRFFPLRGLGKLAEKLRPDVSIISAYAQFGHEVALDLQRALRGVLSNVLIYKADIGLDRLASLFRQQKELLDACNQEVRRLDLGLRESTLAEEPIFFQFHHDGLEGFVPWLWESHGTQSFLRSFPLIWGALRTGGCALVDELDASIHPKILQEIVRWFRDPERNPQNGQLFFTCHNTALLEDLQKEEIVLCEKDASGCTEVFRLADVKNVRRGENFFRAYLNGSYGALPNIG